MLKPRKTHVISLAEKKFFCANSYLTHLLRPVQIVPLLLNECSASNSNCGAILENGIVDKNRSRNGIDETFFKRDSLQSDDYRGASSTSMRGESPVSLRLP